MDEVLLVLSQHGFSLQLKDTAERILAVDSASSMVEEMLKHGQNLLTVGSTLHPFMQWSECLLALRGCLYDVSMINPALSLYQDTHALSMCVFLGFDADPSLNVAARIHGPNVSSYLSPFI